MGWQFWHQNVTRAFVALQATTNSVSTTTAGITRATVHPQAFLGAAAMRGAPLLAAIGDDRVAGVFEDIGRDSRWAVAISDSDLFIVQCGDEAKWVDPFNKADF